jgi:hypothetical protein
MAVPNLSNVGGSGWSLASTKIHLTAREIQSYLFEYDAIAAAQECYDERFGHKSMSN